MVDNNIESAIEPTDMSQMTATPDIEVEIEDPEKVTIGIGGMEIEIDPDAESSEDFNANLAEQVSTTSINNL